MNNIISVIVPVYNVESYLPKCIDSILAQTYKDLEIILVDDGSTDDSGLICDQYGKKDSRIRVIHQENSGRSIARNAGLDICTGFYIGFVDSDDWIEPEMYDEMVTALIQSNADFATCMANGVYDGIDGVKPSQKLWHELYCQNTVLKDDEIFRIIFANSTSVWSKLFKRELFGDCRFRGDAEYLEDALFLADHLYKANSAVIVPKSLYNYYRTRSGNTFTSIDDRIYEYIDNAKTIYHIMSDRGIGEVGVKIIHKFLRGFLKKLPQQHILSTQYRVYIKRSISLAKEPSLKDVISFYKCSFYKAQWKRWLFVYRHFPCVVLLRRRLRA